MASALRCRAASGSAFWAGFSGAGFAASPVLPVKRPRLPNTPFIKVSQSLLLMAELPFHSSAAAGAAAPGVSIKISIPCCGPIEKKRPTCYNNRRVRFFAGGEAQSNLGF